MALVQSIGVIVKPDAVAKPEFLSSRGDLAKLCNDVADMVRHGDSLVGLEALLAADGLKGEPPREVLERIQRWE
ncbi:hypothetical protein CDV31_017134 [Fusarium ambrosium]|uniref:Uncharacterized protein n=1 Tax=Fusarium ambrosium TaxID=131363 RepID=A0A428RRY5_9HYPO|nr:hypothetical protein CDV31_017134 [Fusarium ambrosium]